MKVARFGENWNEGYALPDVNGEIEFATDREPQIDSVSGVNGGFDFSGTENYPIDPAVLQYKFTLSSSQYHNIDKLLDEMKANTLARGRDKLWMVLRDEITHRWAWAKCIHFDHKEKAGEGYLNVEVATRWSLSEGIWYGEPYRLHRITEPSGTGSSSFTLINAGNTPAHLRVEANGNFFNYELWNNTNGHRWKMYRATPAFDSPIVDSAAYRCVYGALSDQDGYVYLTYGTFTPQSNWMVLQPGANSMIFYYDIAGLADFVDFRWYDAYLI